MTDPAELTARLIRCPSVTPDAGEAIALLEGELTAAGFEVHRPDRGGVPNLFARWGAKGAARSFGFNGHLDVVPVGDTASWTHPPFSGHVAGGILWGRGATDMKSGVAAFATAAMGFVAATPPDGAVILTVTGDEEGPSIDGTAAILDWMEGAGERMSACLVGEPTCVEALGDMVKIGRRGSLTVAITATGVQGHAAYPEKARNPVHALLSFLGALTAEPLDEGTAQFSPSGLQVTSIDVGNPASNVIPEVARATLNIRFNDRHTGASLMARLEAEAAHVRAAIGVVMTLTPKLSGEAFITQPGRFTDLVSAAVTEITGRTPVLSTTGGTSDARFIRAHCPVVEFGLVGNFMHQVDERVPLEEIRALSGIYRRILERWFAFPAGT